MEYKFTIKSNLDDTVYIIDAEEKFDVLSRFSDAYWTTYKVQEIIDGVDKRRTNSFNNAYKWANEDIYVLSFEHGVFFTDLLAERAGQKSEKQDLDITHDEFINFLKDFKKFIEQNS
ncbi:hypothetical protein [uncultured Olleya sp.]|uniref:hypothetical protein n=1 Tax=uncultured Olleya sp. TaxID=757243 RepID=UPI002597393B|nr:hypothetical protein [uncultured Olleya sp.]